MLLGTAPCRLSCHCPYVLYSHSDCKSRLWLLLGVQGFDGHPVCSHNLSNQSNRKYKSAFIEVITRQILYCLHNTVINQEHTSLSLNHNSVLPVHISFWHDVTKELLRHSGTGELYYQYDHDDLFKSWMTPGTLPFLSCWCVNLTSNPTCSMCITQCAIFVGSNLDLNRPTVNKMTLSDDPQMFGKTKFQLVTYSHVLEQAASFQDLPASSWNLINIWFQH